MARSTAPYSFSPIWSDILPLPQDDGSSNPLAAIAYTEEYSEAMSYLRAVMAKNEYSDRALDLTRHIILLNPAHYTVWLYRSKILFELKKDLREEIAWLNGVALKFQKNYQIWHHRQLIIDRLDDPTGEVDFIGQMFEKDAKNYHVWSYRQYLLTRFPDQLTPTTELSSISLLLQDDILNNSAWNHRFFLLFGSPSAPSPPLQSTVSAEIVYAQDAIEKAPQNQSPWSYLRGVLKKGGLKMSSLEDFAGRFVQLGEEGKEEKVRSSHAMDLLAEIYAADENECRKQQADRLLRLLGERYDPIRKGYWEWRRGMLGLPVPKTAEAGEERAAVTAA